MIIGLSGYAGSGKDALASILVKNHGYTRLAFADPIREFLYKINPIVACSPTGYLRDLVNLVGWDAAKQEAQVRRLLQDVGVGAREMFGDDFWVKAAISKIETGKNYVITDVRFPNEAERIINMWGEIWRVTRPDVSSVNNHISETAMDSYKFDRFINNAGDLNNLETIVKEFVTRAHDV